MTLRQLRRFLTLHARLLFAWNKPARTKVRRSVSAQFAVRKRKAPKMIKRIECEQGVFEQIGPNMMQWTGKNMTPDDAEHERKMRAVEDAMQGKR